MKPQHWGLGVQEGGNSLLHRVSVFWKWTYEDLTPPFGSSSLLDLGPTRPIDMLEGRVSDFEIPVAE